MHRTSYDADSATLREGKFHAFDINIYSDIVVVGLNHRWNGSNDESIFCILVGDVDFVQIIHDEADAGNL